MNRLSKTMKQMSQRYATKPVSKMNGKLTTTMKPPVVWFPSQDEDCDYKESKTGPAFKAFSFLALIMAATNLVSVLVGNASNNLNDNNDNNNNNNIYVQNSVQNNPNNNNDVFKETIMGRRRRIKRDFSDQKNFENILCNLWSESVPLNGTISAEEITAVVGIEYLKIYVQAYLLKLITEKDYYSLVSENWVTNSFRVKKRWNRIYRLIKDDAKYSLKSCILRLICDGTKFLSEWGSMAKEITKILSSPLQEWLSSLVENDIPKLSLQNAVENGNKYAVPFHQETARQYPLSDVVNIPSKIENPLEVLSPPDLSESSNRNSLSSTSTKENTLTQLNVDKSFLLTNFPPEGMDRKGSCQETYYCPSAIWKSVHNVRWLMRIVNDILHSIV